ncbi:SCF ubiquitin ligase complex subunit [Gryganskiella cystojenkinii]|nr:SCF ubiquitin ligase complex subunit [Gryganskiella cystojenkinii]
MESIDSPPRSHSLKQLDEQQHHQTTPPTSHPTTPSQDRALWSTASSSSSSFSLSSSASPSVPDIKMRGDNDEQEEEEDENDSDNSFSLSSREHNSNNNNIIITTSTPPSPSTPSIRPLFPDLPSEIILYIFRFLTSAHDLRSAVLVCKLWCCCGMDLLWSKPSLLTLSVIERMIETLSPSPKTLFPYAEYIRRLNLSFLAHDLTDSLLTQFAACTRLERLLLAGSNKTTETGLKQILKLSSCRGLYALDLSEIPAVTDSLLEHISLSCPQLHTLYLGSCSTITDDALIKLSQCTLLTDTSILALTKHCPQLMEVDLTNCGLVTDTAVQSLFSSNLAPQIRDINLTQVTAHLTDTAFEMISPTTHQFEGLRILNLTSCVNLTDETLLRILPATPRLRNLALTKCDKITDRGASAIKTIGKYLHYLHLGHCAKITDKLIEILASHCPRIRYLDLACCSRITDAALFELAQLPKLRRLGLVKCSNITDHGLYGLLFSQILRQTLERVHLSYCIHLSEVAVASLVIQCNKLTHLSLTGVPAFIAPRFQVFCRPPPAEFTPHQREVFCVFSGRGVRDLRQAMIEDLGVVNIFSNHPPPQVIIATATTAIAAASVSGSISAPVTPLETTAAAGAAMTVMASLTSVPTTTTMAGGTMPLAWADMLQYRTQFLEARAAAAASSSSVHPLASSPFNVFNGQGLLPSDLAVGQQVPAGVDQDVDMEDVSQIETAEGASIIASDPEEYSAAVGEQAVAAPGESSVIFLGSSQQQQLLNPSEDEQQELGQFFRSVGGHTAAVQQLLFRENPLVHDRHGPDRAVDLFGSDIAATDHSSGGNQGSQEFARCGSTTEAIEDATEEDEDPDGLGVREQHDHSRLRLPSPGTLAKSLNRESHESGAGSASPAEDIEGDDDDEEEEDEDL